MSDVKKLGSNWLFLYTQNENCGLLKIKKGNKQMSQAFDLQLTCPQCGTEFESTGYTLIDKEDEADAEVLWKLQDGSLNIAVCPKCNSSGLIPIPIVLHDPEREILLAFVPNAQEMDEQTLGAAVGPILQSFIESVPEEERPDYLFQPVITDDLEALQAVARGELVTQDEEDEDEDEGESEEPEILSPEQQQQMRWQLELLQSLIGAPDSLQRISLLRQYKFLVDDLFQQMIGLILQQSAGDQPELTSILQKIMNEVEVFLASSTD